mgnify:FL=1
MTRELTPEEEGFVYIAGPYRAKDGGHDVDHYDEIEANIQRAREAAIFLAEHDIPYFCPHMNSAHMEVHAASVLPAYWYRMDMTIMPGAKALWLLEGWTASQGATDEYKAARKQDIPVFAPQEGEDLVRTWRERCRDIADRSN